MTERSSDPPTPTAAPAAPETAHRGMVAQSEIEPFLPRVRWRIWGPILALLVAFPTGWMVLKKREADQRRARLLAEHASLTGTLAPEYQARRTEIENWIVSSVGPWAGEMRDPSLTLDGLTQSPVLYARTRLGEIHNRRDLLPSIRHHYEDQIAVCLGAQVQWLRILFDKGEFLLPEFVDAIQGANDSERLHALSEDLRFRLRRDTEFLVTAMRRRYVVLAVDEGRSPIDGPSRVYVFDQQTHRAVLRSRSEGRDVTLIPFRIHGLPTTPALAPNAHARPPSVSQHDCSIANGVRRTLGVDPNTMMNVPEPEPLIPDAGAARDASRD